MPVLITAGLYPEAYRLQRLLFVQDVLYTDEQELPLIPGIKSLVLPSFSSPSFVHEILKACLNNHIDRIYPLKQGEIMELSLARQLFSEYHIDLVIPSDEWLRINLSDLQQGHPAIAVLKDGELIAGTLPDNHLSDLKETGVFTWATIHGKTGYSLYLIKDARV